MPSCEPEGATPPVLAIDPGRSKCGLAVVRGDGTPLQLRIVPAPNLGAAVAELVQAHGVATVLMGDRTTSREAARIVRGSCPGAQVRFVDEHMSTLRARQRYFDAHPPRGLLRLLPRGLRTPPEPYDDYVALVLAEDYLGKSKES